VVAHFFERKSHRAVAKDLDIARRTVTYRIRRGVEEIRKSLKKRRVSITGAMLAGLITAHAAHAAPAWLAASLSKVALAGTGGATTAASTTGAGGCSGPKEDAGTIAFVDLGPDDEEEIIFTIDAPATVPVRVVDKKGRPIEGVSPCIGGSGGMQSDAEGRAVLDGVTPDVALQVAALADFRLPPSTFGHPWPTIDAFIIGVSEPFGARPGETVPEVEGVCVRPEDIGVGGVEGGLMYSERTSATNIRFKCYMRFSINDVVNSTRQSGRSQSDGAFSLQTVLPEGDVRLLFVYEDEETGQMYGGALENVEIVADAVTDLGMITVESVSEGRAAGMIGEIRIPR